MAEPLKNRMGRPVVELLADRFTKIDPRFDRAKFLAVADALHDLELKDRIAAIADQLANALPPDYPTAVDLVVAVARSGACEDFAGWPLCTFVERHGVDHPEESIRAMEALTRVWSCEFAIRPFLDRHPKMTMAAVIGWCSSSDESVRRLASEGTRPLLPWAPRVRRLLDNPELGLSLLEKLRFDESETVRRSVANHLNDVSKSHPDLVADITSRWKEENADPKMIRHALRTLIKRGHTGALTVLGFTVDASVEIRSFEVTPPKLHLGDSIQLCADLRSTSNQHQKLVVDFVIHHPTANGAVSPRVFKWTVVSLDSGSSVVLRKSRMIATASTRRYTAGRHRVELQVAGNIVATSEFDLRESSPQ